MVGSELQGTVNHLVNRVKTLKAEFSANTNPGNPTLLTVEKYKLGKILQ
jgi:hypothetical protein